MLTPEDRRAIISELMLTGIVFSPHRHVRVTYRLPGNVFTRLYFFLKLILIGRAVI